MEKITINNVVFALCEGSHDVAFLYRLFVAEGFKTYKEMIRNLPPPINQLILQNLKKSNYETMKLSEVGKKTIPTEILYRKQTLVMFYAIGGDRNKKDREKLMAELLAFKPTDEDDLDKRQDLDFSIIYFFDADDKGLAWRVQEVEKEINETFNTTSTRLSHADEPLVLNDFKIGCYIFANTDGRGKLEDIMIPLMEQDNKIIFDEAAKYLELKDESRLKKLEITHNDDGTVAETRSGEKMKFDAQKSKICTAGQLQNSGKSNVVIIKDCDYITLSKIKQNPQCREIVNFINAMIS